MKSTVEPTTAVQARTINQGPSPSPRKGSPVDSTIDSGSSERWSVIVPLLRVAGSAGVRGPHGALGEQQ